MDKLQTLFKQLLGLPVLASEGGAGTDRLIVYVHLLMLLLFVGWLAYFVFALWRFNSARSPKADYAGVTSHASSYLEVAVAGIEGIILIFVAIPLWARAVDKFPAKTESTVIYVVAQQFAWNIRYADKEGNIGRQDMKFVNEKNIFGIDPSDAEHTNAVQELNVFHVPINKPVIAYISSKDVIHSFKLVAFRVTQDAIPGMRIPVHFQPVREGTFQIFCAQLCGNGHASMAGGRIIVESEADYKKWLASKTTAAPVSFE